MLQAVIGEGSFGRVYRGIRQTAGPSVAVKVIKPWWAEDPEWVFRFEREAQLMARVSDPGIVQIYDVGHADQGLYYVAELVDGESLELALRRGRLAPPEACEIAEQLSRALAHAHARRVVHGDIKPANVLISQHGSVKVGDFGVARLAEGSSAGAAATIAGTPRYMAPEQARGRGTTMASDVYSVGVVLYEMLAGQPPFSGDSVVDLALQHLQDPPPPLPLRRTAGGGRGGRACPGQGSTSAVRRRRRARPARSRWRRPRRSRRRSQHPTAASARPRARSRTGSAPAIARPASRRGSRSGAT